jgi:hypothetical protein
VTVTYRSRRRCTTRFAFLHIFAFMLNLVTREIREISLAVQMHLGHFFPLINARDFAQYTEVPAR